MRGNNESDRINKELELMEIEATTQSETRSILSVLSDKALLLPVILVCALQGGQQLSGVNAVFYYSVMIFQNAGLSEANAKWSNLGVGVVNLITAFFTPYIMERYNRRPVILLSCMLSGLFLVSLCVSIELTHVISWFSVLCVLAVFAYILVYQIGLGPIPYFIGSELFEVSTRSAAMSLGSLSSWACNFLVAMAFQPIAEAIGKSLVFLVFACACFALCVLLYRYLPESRGKQPSEIAPIVAHGFRSKIR